MGDDEGRWHDLEAEDALGCGLFDARSGQSPQAASFQISGDATQHLGEVCTRAAAWIKHVDVLRRQSIGYAEIILEGPVHAGDHVSHHLGRRIPDAKLLAQGGVERLKERFVEILHRLALVESIEEGFPLHAVQRRRRPVKHLDEAKGCNWLGDDTCWNRACSTGTRRCQTASCQLKAPVGDGVWRAQSTHAEKMP